MTKGPISDEGKRSIVESSSCARSDTGGFATPHGALTGPLRVLSVLVVSIYLSLVAAWLMATGRISGAALKTTIRKLIKSRLRRPYEVSIETFRPDDGFCWRAKVKSSLLSDLESRSMLLMYEDGRPLGPAHASHYDIRTIGRGRYSHWGRMVYFSTSDNSDPQTNGRRYTVKEAR